MIPEIGLWKIMAPKELKRKPLPGSGSTTEAYTLAPDLLMTENIDNPWIVVEPLLDLR